VTAYSFGMVTCNVGDVEVQWQASTPFHPVLVQNLYRLRDGRFEQVGQSWAFHVILALSLADCFPDCGPTDGTTLGIHCSTTNSASIGGYQPRLGPRSEIDAASGDLVFPHGQPPFDPTVGRRLQASDSDLDPASNPGARYVGELLTLAHDDSLSGNIANNASWREVLVTGSAPTFQLQLTASTRRGEPAVLAWQALDPEVRIGIVDIPGDGRMLLGSRATPLGNGRYRYDYALQNLTSHRSARSFGIPVEPGAMVTGTTFHDVASHSGEPYDTSDWTSTLLTTEVTWSTATFAENENANALRWGTLYSFSFEVPAPPATGAATVSLFRPGSPDTVQMEAIVPVHARSGNVNAASGEVTDVLLANGLSGGFDRTVHLAPTDPLVLRVLAPPMAPPGGARFVVYAWSGVVPSNAGTALPFSLGATVLPTPLTPGLSPQPARIANGFGHEPLLGEDDWPGPAPGPAPRVLLDLSSGTGLELELHLQGLIADRGSLQGQVAVTNALRLVIAD
jgi:hypothetical protein